MCKHWAPHEPDGYRKSAPGHEVQGKEVLQSLCWVKSSLEQAHQECGMWTHWAINTTALSTQDTQGLQWHFAAICLHSFVVAHLMQGNTLVPFVLGAEIFVKSPCKINCLKRGFLNQNKTIMKKNQQNLPYPCQTSLAWLTVRSFFVLVQTISFPKAMLYTESLHSHMQLNIAFLNRSGHTEHAVNTSLQDFSKSSAE